MLHRSVSSFAQRRTEVSACLYGIIGSDMPCTDSTPRVGEPGSSTGGSSRIGCSLFALYGLARALNPEGRAIGGGAGEGDGRGQ